MNDLWGNGWHAAQQRKRHRAGAAMHGVRGRIQCVIASASTETFVRLRGELWRRDSLGSPLSPRPGPSILAPSSARACQ